MAQEERLCETLAVNVARVSHPVALFSLEMQRKVALKYPGHGERHRQASPKTRRIDEDETSRALTAMGEAELPLYLGMCGYRWPGSARAASGTLPSTAPWRGIVDYLQLVKPASIKAPRELQVSGSRAA